MTDNRIFDDARERKTELVEMPEGLIGFLQKMIPEIPASVFSSSAEDLVEFLIALQSCRVMEPAERDDTQK